MLFLFIALFFSSVCSFSYYDYYNYPYHYEYYYGQTEQTSDLGSPPQDRGFEDVQGNFRQMLFLVLGVSYQNVIMSDSDDQETEVNYAPLDSDDSVNFSLRGKTDDDDVDNDTDE